jgi:hypothetical protein
LQCLFFAKREVPLLSYFVFSEYKIRRLWEKTLYFQLPKRSLFFFSFGSLQVFMTLENPLNRTFEREERKWAPHPDPPPTKFHFTNPSWIELIGREKYATKNSSKRFIAFRARDRFCDSFAGQPAEVSANYDTLPCWSFEFTCSHVASNGQRACFKVRVACSICALGFYNL